MIQIEDLKILYGEITTSSLWFSRKEKNPLAIRFLLPLEIYSILPLGLFIVLINHKN